VAADSFATTVSAKATRRIQSLPAVWQVENCLLSRCCWLLRDDGVGKKQREEFSRSLLYGRLTAVYSRAAADSSLATKVSAKNNEKN
jgi:hypothetical protein